jgi:hypothetical protein
MDEIDAQKFVFCSRSILQLHQTASVNRGTDTGADGKYPDQPLGEQMGNDD